MTRDQFIERCANADLVCTNPDHTSGCSCACARFGQLLDEYVEDAQVVINALGAELEGYRRWLNGEQYGVSADICDEESFGYGKLDDNGFFEFPIPVACVEMSRQLGMERAFCICGCPESDHESYGEDGEACEDQHHECIRVCAAAASITGRLRAQLKAKDETREKTLAECLDHYEARLSAQADVIADLRLALVQANVLLSLSDQACGDLAEVAANNLDHGGYDNSKWYRAVKRFRAARGVKA